MSKPQLISFVLLWIVILVEGALLFLLYRHVGLAYAERGQNGLSVGTHAPSILVTTIDGQHLSLESLLRNQVTLLIFGSLNCSTCQQVMADQRIKELVFNLGSPAYFVINSSEFGHDDAIKFYYQKETAFVLATVDQSVFYDFKIKSTPYAYVFDAEGIVVASSPIARPQSLLDLWSAVDGNHADDQAVNASAIA